MKQGIYTKLDWFTGIFEDFSFTKVLEEIGLDADLYIDEFIQNAYEQSRGFDEVQILALNGVHLETSSFNFYGIDESIGVFDKVCQKIRCDISGSGLDWLRSQGIDVDIYLRSHFESMPNVHVTRCDYAFDFVNFQGDFLDKMIDYCNRNHTDSNRLCIIGKTGNIRYSMRIGDQKTLYLGATTSEKLIRIYDKRMQYTDPVTGLYNKPNPYENPDSWIRIELQTRSKFADNFIYSSGDMLSILKWVYENYAFADLSTPAWRREPSEIWSSLFDWEAIPKLIMRNIDFGEVKTPTERAIGCVKRDIISIMIADIALRKEGKPGISYVINEFLKTIQNWDCDSGTLNLRLRKYRSLTNRLKEAGVSEEDLENSSLPLFRNMNRIEWSSK